MNRVINLRKSAQETAAPVTSPVAVASRSRTHLTSQSPVLARQEKHTPEDDGFSWKIMHHADGSRRITAFVACLAVIAALVWIFQSNLLFALLLVLGAIAFVIAPHNHQETHASLEAHGVVINGATYYYRDLHSFWIDYVPGGVKELSLKVDRWYLPYLKVPLGDKNPNHVRGFLMEFLPEQEHETSLTDALMRFLKVY